MKKINVPFSINANSEIRLEGEEYNVIQGVEIRSKYRSSAKLMLEYYDPKSEIQTVTIRLANEWFAGAPESHDYYLLELDFHEGCINLNVFKVPKEP